MSDYTIKTVLAVLLLGTGLAAFLAMMARFGRPGDETRAERLRRFHKKAGWAYVVILAPLAVFGADFLVEIGNGLTARGTFHFVLAAGLVAIVLLKLLVVKAYRQQMKYAQALGLAIFTLTLVIFLITAGYFVLIRTLGR